VQHTDLPERGRRPGGRHYLRVLPYVFICRFDALLTWHHSHLYCMDCANNYGLLSRSLGSHPYSVCPGCTSPITEADAVAVTRLNPSDEYKSCVLSGHPPSIIMECAGRALAFWANQVAQQMWVAAT
jgi:E3 ubiquitin-protein ligase CCNP1IP1